MKTPSRKKLMRIARSLGEWHANHGPTGGQIRGPVWRGRPAPRNLSAVATVARDPEVQKANDAIDAERYPRMGFMPDSSLGRILMDRRVTRSTRRLLLSTIQAPETRRRRRNERRVARMLTAVGVTPS